MASKTKDFIFNFIEIVSWIIFIGLCIEAGALLVNFIFSLYKPEFVQNLYQKLDLASLYKQSKLSFISMYSFILVIAFMKAVLFYLVIRMIGKLDLKNPFSSFVYDQIVKISYITFCIGLLSYIARQIAKGLQHRGIELEQLNRFWEDSQAFIMMAAVVYVISVIFKKGLELQNENELTI